MQQMSNILLAGNNTNKSSQVKDTMQVSDNQSFLSVFNQARQTSSFQNADIADTKKSSEHSDIINAELDLSEPLDEGDVALVFAQLDMALSFDKVKADGKILPHDEIASNVEMMPDEVALDSALLPISDAAFALEPQDLAATSDIETIVDELSITTIQPPLAEELNSSYIASLPTSQLEQLMTFSSLTEAELVSLSYDDLAKIVDDFNLQSPVIDKSIVDSVEVDWVDADKAIQVAQVTQVTSGLSSEKDVNKVIAADKLAADLFGKQNQSSIAASSTGDKVNILGTATDSPSTGITPKVDATNKTQLSVELIKPNVAAAGVTTETLDKTLNFDGLSTVEESVDTKALQNQSSFTPIHKSDVPQFQLALKQHGESQVQMQEMIQRFSPVMKQQLITMVSNGIQQAEIRLDPPELGHLMVKIQVHGDQTQVQFHVAQTQTRDLIEQAIPRLREMLAQEGLQLADSQVSQGGGGRDGQSQESSQGTSQQHDLDENSALEHSMFQNDSESLQSGIDYYA
ncbi:flagellar hook-length control protein FliK [Shewanella subflava]|uniref:Flagellar hook-length control protein FliK n=1 Tax=Shewanella subflava TaxID=2986476 RepID=A0ABT3IC40_9GAMM|nr:flagellar hook-length control protein FliK [Shewanella subflava]MCW3173605.1 flagellar hook-length control protein FliK [Shewanella subflava]